MESRDCRWRRGRARGRTHCGAPRAAGRDSRAHQRECGKKLAITGGKKGNFTHSDEPEVMARQFSLEPRTLLPLMRRFPFTRIVELFEELGIHHLVDDDGCIWPNPKSAPRLRDELVHAFLKAGGRIETGTHATHAGLGTRFRIVSPNCSLACPNRRWLALDRFGADCHRRQELSCDRFQRRRVRTGGAPGHSRGAGLFCTCLAGDRAASSPSSPASRSARPPRN